MSAASNTTDAMLEAWMRSAIAAAIQGIAEGEHPFGAAIVGPDGTVVSKAHNCVGSTHDPAAHAEVLAIASAARSLGTSQLNEHWLVATGEPCPMCLSTAAMAGIRNIGFGASAATIQNAGYETLGIEADKLAAQFNCDLALVGSVLELECSALLLNHPNED